MSERLRRAYAPKSEGPVQSALRLLARFSDACPDRELFKRPRFFGDMEASAYNEWTMILFVWWAATTDSPTTGRRLKAKTLKSYVSLLKGYLSFNYAFDVVDRTIRLKRLIKSLVEEEPLGGVRKKRRGFRRMHLRRLGRTAWAQQTDVDTVNKVAALASAWHVLARGGELCPGCKHAQWRADLHPTRADLAFYVNTKGQRYAVLWLRPLKKRGEGPQPKVPQYILEHDGSGSDVYRLLRRLEEFDPVPAEERAQTPLFRVRVAVRGGGVQHRHMTVPQLKQVTRKAARLIGYTDMAVWGAHSARIGGATDLADGDASGGSMLLLKAKGRWASDIGAIYSRLTRKALLAASALMQKSKGRDLEEIFPEFVQPA